MGGLSAASGASAVDSLGTAFTDQSSDEGARVLASFYADTYKEDNLAKDSLTQIGIVGAEVVIGKVLGPLVGKAGGKSNSSNANKILGAKNVRSVDAITANSAHELPLYSPNMPIRDFEADGNTTYVRGYTEGSTKQSGRWMMNAEDIRGLTPKQIQDKFDLPDKPTHVQPPQGTTIRTGTVQSSNFGGNGGGTQFELQGRISDDSFSNARVLQ